jgi:hypothetical protein
MRVPNGEKAGWCHWSITGFHVSPTDLGPSAGISPSCEQAVEDFAARWRLWLEWAGLRGRASLRSGAAALMYGSRGNRSQARH